MRHQFQNQSLLALGIVLGGMLVSAENLRAASQTWDGDQGQNSFYTPGNWVGGAIPGTDTTASNGTANGANGNQDIATFPSGSAFSSVNFALSAANAPAGAQHMRYLGGLVFDKSLTLVGLAPTSRLNLSGGPVADVVVAPNLNVIIEGDAATAALFDTGASGVGSDLYLGRNNQTAAAVTHTWLIDDNSVVDVQARMVGVPSGVATVTLDKTGNGTLILSGANGGSGGNTTHMKASAGILEFASAHRNGSRTFSISSTTVADGATLKLSSSTPTAYTSPYLVSENDGGLFLSGAGFGGIGALFASTDQIILPGSTTVTPTVSLNSAAVHINVGGTIATPKTLTFRDDIMGAGQLVKIGDGTLSLTTTNDFQGGTSVVAGKLLINAPASAVSVTATSAITQVGVTSVSQFTVSPADLAKVSVGQHLNGAAPGATVVGFSSFSSTVFLNTVVTGPAGVITLDPITAALNASNGGGAARVVDVLGGATIGGNGSIVNSDVTINANGIIAPGNSAGTLTVGGLALLNDSIAQFELENTAGIHSAGGVNNDLIDVVGALTGNLGATINIDVTATDLTGDLGNGGIGAGGVWTLAQYDSLTGTGIPTFAVTGVDSGYSSYVSIVPDDLVNFPLGAGSVILTLTAVPEPTAMSIAGIGIICLGLRRFRRR